MRSIRFLTFAILAALLAGPAIESPAAAADEFPGSWYYNSRSKQHRELEGKPAPALKIARWHNGDAVTLKSLRGKVVVIDFWGDW